MSLARFVYYSTVLSGWAAFAAWLIAETLFLGNGSLGVTVEAVCGLALVGAGIGAGLALVSALGCTRWQRQYRRLVVGLVGGGVGGALGGLLGATLYSGLALPRVIGWMSMGLAIGCVDGIYDRSPRKLRNGLIGGTLGGGCGGLLFDLVAGSGSGMFGRAVAFVVLGLSIGALIGLAYVMLKEAWLTVLDGYRSGRQLILTQEITLLGRGDHLPLPFLGYGSKELEAEHLRITRQADGRYVIEDNRSRIGTRVNGQRIQGPVTLHDGDLIKLGSNVVRFNVHQRSVVAGDQRASDQAVSYGGQIASPPPPPGVSTVTLPRDTSWPPLSPPVVGEQPSPAPPPPSGSSASLGPRIPPPPPPPK